MTMRYFSSSLFSCLLICTLLFAGCAPGKRIVGTPTDLRTLDTLVVSAPLPNTLRTPEDFKLERYNPSEERSFQLLHTGLDLAFDWDKQHVLGTAYLELTPWFYPQDSLLLDAKNFLLHRVQLETSQGLEDAEYAYDGFRLLIHLNKTYKTADTVRLYVDYTARPAERRGISGGSAITSDQGLFFINPSGDDPNKPRQIWTQGETEYNSCWFPTIDKPNQRCTQEIQLTVDTVFETLSNGVMISSSDNGDGTRTDVWKLDEPHAPYLFMVAVGDYAVVPDQWRKVPLWYYVEHEYRDDARDIFAHTPEMMELFSSLLQVPFPWPKYAQVVVRDYVSGAMENTTASVFGEFVQQTRRELIDNDNDLIVAHELFHQWFGDLVTCESWANLTMNEGFANYSEYLWLEHHDGVDAAEYHRLNEIAGYLRQAARDPHDLIYYDYDDMEATFDAHSYNKGGLVLHMLRKMVGDDAFFASLNRYLTKNAYSSVEAADLRLAFEAVTGRDLKQFFDQWYFSSGHPELLIDYRWDSETKEVQITVEQVQDPDRFPAIFILPAVVDIFFGNGIPVVRYEVTVNQRKQTFSFPAPSQPEFVAFDAEEVLLAEKSENYSLRELVSQFYHAKAFPDRLSALNSLVFAQSREEVGSDTVLIDEVLLSALSDPSPIIRSISLEVADITNPEILEIVVRLASTDPDSKIRATALDALGLTRNPRYADVVVKMIERDSAFPVIAAGLRALPMLDIDKALAIGRATDHHGNMDVICGLASVFAFPADPSYLPFFEEWLPSVEGYAAFDFFAEYAGMVARFADPKMSLEGLRRLKSIGCGREDSPWRRVAAYRALGAAANLIAQQQTLKDESSSEFGQLNALLDAIDEFQTTIRTFEGNASLGRYF